MRANDYAVERTRLNRRIYHSALGEWMMGPGSLALGLVGSVVGGIVYPASLWLSLPIMIFWAPRCCWNPGRCLCGCLRTWTASILRRNARYRASYWGFAGDGHAHLHEQGCWHLVYGLFAGPGCRA